MNKKDKLIAEMEKDMKEMLKKIAKLQKKLKAAQGKHLYMYADQLV